MSVTIYWGIDGNSQYFNFGSIYIHIGLGFIVNGSRTITPRTITPWTITPLGQIPPGQLPPQITEFPKHKSTKFTSHKVYKSQSLQVTKSTQITGTKSQYIRVQILQNTSKYKGSAWLWQTLVIWSRNLKSQSA